MKRKRAGQAVPKGLYFDVRQFRLFLVKDDDTVLPGAPGHLYLKLNISEMVLVILMMTLVYVIFIPFIGPLMVLAVAGTAVFFFLCQKVACHILQGMCKAESWLCDLTHKYLCERCGKNCNESAQMAVMMVKAFFGSLLILAGILIGRFLLR